GGNGGGVHCRSSTSLQFTRCTLAANSAGGNGGGMYCHTSTPILNSSTVAFSEGIGIYFSGSPNSQLTFCNIFGNSGGAFEGLGIPDSLGDIATINANGDSCDVYHNIFLDPVFVSSDDFHLQANSPCIDAGDPSLPLDPDTTISDIGAFYFDQVDVIIRPSLAPMAYALRQNYPNPFNSTTMIRFDIPQAAKVELRIYNILGQEVASLTNDIFPAGTHRVSWDAANLPSGIYIYQLKAGSFRDAKKMVLLK
ncbi:MAG: T9SS type A sorting domain-containing protein, partial [bacterium]